MKISSLFYTCALALGSFCLLPSDASFASPASESSPQTKAVQVLTPRQKAEANPNWFMPINTGKSIVNPYLTPARVMKHPDDKFDGQTVLWEGRVLKHTVKNGQNYLTLATDSGTAEVHYPDAARNLEYDRTKFRLAVKGRLKIKDGKFQGLHGLSCILLEPPLEYSYKNWLNGRTPDAVSYFSWRILFHNPEIKLEDLEYTSKAIIRSCRENNLDPSLFGSLIQIESAWDWDAVSVSGAQGLGQLMPKTSVGLNVLNPFDPAENLLGSSKMVKGLVNRWQSLDNPYAAVLASYNAGPTAVMENGGKVPPYTETTNYVYFIGYVRRDMLRQAEKYGISL